MSDDRTTPFITVDHACHKFGQTGRAATSHPDTTVFGRKAQRPHRRLTPGSADRWTVIDPLPSTVIYPLQ
jgi:hypothetical protein